MNHYLYTYIIIGLGFSLGYLVRLIEEGLTYTTQDFYGMVMAVFLYPIMVLNACIESTRQQQEEKEDNENN